MPIALVCVAGAALRFATLDGQSLWFDEAVTAQLLRMNLPDMLSAIPDSESTPPLYYVLGWLWSQVAGTGEVGLRSLTALLGTATIPVVWALARRLGGDRAALAAAALTAVNPMLVWFSQEARAYALLGLVAAAAALLWLRALEQPRPARLLAWGAVAALALATHYYAIFLVGPQALWLLARAPTLRARAIALALPLAAGAALAPLALGQRSNDSAAFIGESGLDRRLAQVVKQFLVGYDAPAEKLLAVVSALVLLTAAAGLVRLLRDHAGVPPRARDDAMRLLVVADAAVLVPALLALAGEDHVVTRNVVAALPLAAALAGAGLAAVPSPAAIAATATACALALVAVIGVATDPALQRDDWRGAARALGPPPPSQTRIVVASPAALVPLRYYLPRLHPFGALPVTTAQIDYLALAPRRGSGRGTPPRPPSDDLLVPAFTVAGRSESETFTVVRMRATEPRPILAGLLSSGLDGDRSELLKQLPGQT
ncbi:MAG TPA: glycosyltransferase family 39 protein [Solirubrobacteraceae bacterium]|nr:glycosyltransferase family 39 protein [Solirubrobacteraceae bacterium]